MNTRQVWGAVLGIALVHAPQRALAQSSSAATPARAAAAPAARPVPRSAAPDDGRMVDWLFLQAEGGLTYAAMLGVTAEGAPALPTLGDFRGFGPSGGFAIGARYAIVALAAHGSFARLDGTRTSHPSTGPGEALRSGFDLGQLMLEAHLRIPLPVVEPYLRVGFGYAWMVGLELDGVARQSAETVAGWTGKVGLGFDVWLGRWVTLGAGVDASLLSLRRGGAARAGASCPASDPVCFELTADGDTAGLAVHTHAQVGVHF